MAGGGACPRAFLWFGLVWSTIGVCMGLSAAVIFLAPYHNAHAAVWAALSGILAAACLHLHILHKRNRIHMWYSSETLDETSVLGFIALAAGLAGLTWYIFYANYEKIPLLPVDKSFYVAAVWAFLTAKWGLGLFITSLSYRSVASNDLRENTPLLYDSA